MRWMSLFNVIITWSHENNKNTCNQLVSDMTNPKPSSQFPNSTSLDSKQKPYDSVLTQISSLLFFLLNYKEKFSSHLLLQM